MCITIRRALHEDAIDSRQQAGEWRSVTRAPYTHMLGRPPARCTTFVCARTHPTGTHACTQVLRLRAATCASVLLFLVAAAPAAWGLQTRCLGLLRCVTAPRRARHATLVLRPRFCDSQRLHHCATHFRDCTAEFPSAPTTLLRLFPATVPMARRRFLLRLLRLRLTVPTATVPVLTVTATATSHTATVLTAQLRLPALLQLRAAAALLLLCFWHCAALLMRLLRCASATLPSATAIHPYRYECCCTSPYKQADFIAHGRGRDVREPRLAFQCSAVYSALSK